MADEADIGNETAAQNLAAAIAQARRENRLSVGREGADECEDCGKEIPKRRREAVPGCRRCVDCQMEIEGMR